MRQRWLSLTHANCREDPESATTEICQDLAGLHSQRCTAAQMMLLDASGLGLDLTGDCMFCT